MASVRFIDVQARPTEFLDFTSLTLDEFQLLVPPFEAAFPAHMAAWWLARPPPGAPPIHGLQELSASDAGRSPVLHSGLPQDLCPPGGPRPPVRHGPEQSQSVDSRPPPRAARGAAHPRRCPCPFPDGLSPAPGGLGGRRGHGGRPPGRGARPHPRA